MNWIENPLFHQLLSEKSSESIFTNKLGSCGEEGERGKTKSYFGVTSALKSWQTNFSYRAHRQSSSKYPDNFLFCNTTSTWA
jgi:hypothetical protein